MSAATQYTPSRDDFAALLEESFLHSRPQRERAVSERQLLVGSELVGGSDRRDIGRPATDHRSRRQPELGGSAGEELVAILTEALREVERAVHGG